LVAFRKQEIEAKNRQQHMSGGAMRRFSFLAVCLGLLLSGCFIESDPKVYSTTSAEQQTAGEQAPLETQGRPMTRGEHSFFLMAIFKWGWWIAYYGLGLIIGTFIYRDAKAQRQRALNINPIWWCLLAVFDALLGLLVYWVLHHSSLRRNASDLTDAQM
jgi:hypothetical protein